MTVLDRSDKRISINVMAVLIIVNFAKVPGPEVTKLFSYSTLLSTKFVLLKNVIIF